MTVSRICQAVDVGIDDVCTTHSILRVGVDTCKKRSSSENRVVKKVV